jgi:PEP-CTERM motif-containing protein
MKTILKLTSLMALAAALLAVSPAPAEASTNSCGFGTQTSPACPGSPTTREYNFGTYFLTLNFGAFGGTVIGGFDVTFEDVHTNQAALQSQLPDGAVCVPIAGLGPGDNCVVFTIVGFTPVQGVNFTGDYQISLAWNAATDDAFPNEPGGLIHLLHDSSLTPGNFFGADITIPGSYFAEPCVIPLPERCDPGIGGRDNNFQRFVVVQFPATAVPVPEPATMFLVATGVGSVLYRRRRPDRRA